MTLLLNKFQVRGYQMSPLTCGIELCVWACGWALIVLAMVLPLVCRPQACEVVAVVLYRLPPATGTKEVPYPFAGFAPCARPGPSHLRPLMTIAPQCQLSLLTNVLLSIVIDIVVSISLDLSHADGEMDIPCTNETPLPVPSLGLLSILPGCGQRSQSRNAIIA